MASPLKRRRTSSPVKANAAGGSSSGSSKGGGLQLSVLKFFGAASSSTSAKQTASTTAAAAATAEQLDGSTRRASEGAQDAGVSVENSGCLSPQKEADVQCPICRRPYPYRHVAAHASSCLDFQDGTGEESATRSAGGTFAGAQDAAEPSSTSRDGRATDVHASSSTSSTKEAEAPQRTTEPLAESSNSSLADAHDGSGTDAAPSTSSNVFIQLMKSHAALKQWASADAAEAKNTAVQGRPHTSSPRAVPFYKIITGTPISVDAFRFGKIEGCTAYFLTHFHGDHYGGLSPSWRWGPIYGSRTTCALVVSHLGVHPKWVRPLPMEEKTLIENTGGVYVTLLDANHCPGSNLFLFEGPQTVDILRPGQNRYTGKKHFRALHCGDFRASPRHTNHPLVLGVDPGVEVEPVLLDKGANASSSSVFDYANNVAIKGGAGQDEDSTPGPLRPSHGAPPKAQKIDTVYLDTTYLNPRYCFPAQEQVVQACADLVLREAARLRAHVDAVEQRKNGDNSAVIKEEAFESTPGMMSSWLSGVNLVKKEDPGWTAPLSFDGPGGRAESQPRQAISPPSPSAVSMPKPSAVKQEDDEMDFQTGEEQLFTHVDDVDEEGMLVSRADDNCELESPVKLEPTDPLEDAVGASSSNVKVEAPRDVKPLSSWLPSLSTNPNARRRNRLLVLVGTYTIGKEKIVTACARALNTRIFCPSPRKYDVYDKLEDGELHALLTRDPAEADVFVTNLSAINGQGLHDLVAELRTQGHDIKRAIAFRPTGWTYKPPQGIDTTAPDLRRLIAWNQTRQFGPDRLFPTRDSTREYQIYGVPYSEHSSFFELTAFALSLPYDRIIATVNVGNPASRAKMEKWFERWAMEKRRRIKAGEGERVPSRTLDYW